MKKLLIVAVGLLSFNAFSYGQQLAATGTYEGNPGFDRGFQTTHYCGNSPESWVRGSAWLDQQTGLLAILGDLETDATNAGPKAQVLVYVYDCNGALLTRVASAEVGRGGKAPGTFAETRFQASINLGSQIGSQACKMTVVANNTGFVDEWFNIPLDQVGNAIAGLVQIASFFF